MGLDASLLMSCVRAFFTKHPFSVTLQWISMFGILHNYLILLQVIRHGPLHSVALMGDPRGAAM